MNHGLLPDPSHSVSTDFNQWCPGSPKIHPSDDSARPSRKVFWPERLRQKCPSVQAQAALAICLLDTLQNEPKYTCQRWSKFPKPPTQPFGDGMAGVSGVSVRPQPERRHGRSTIDAGRAPARGASSTGFTSEAPTAAVKAAEDGPCNRDKIRGPESFISMQGGRAAI